jgi:hypothetical protein
MFPLLASRPCGSGGVWGFEESDDSSRDEKDGSGDDIRRCMASKRQSHGSANAPKIDNPKYTNSETGCENIIHHSSFGLLAVRLAKSPLFANQANLFPFLGQTLKKDAADFLPDRPRQL